MLDRRRPDAIHPRTELCRIAQTQRAQLLQKRQNRVASNERSRKSGSSLFHRLLDFLVKKNYIEESSSHLFCLKEHSKSITWHKYNTSKTFFFMFEQKDNLSSSLCFKRIASKKALEIKSWNKKIVHTRRKQFTLVSTTKHIIHLWLNFRWDPYTKAIRIFLFTFEQKDRSFSITWFMEKLSTVSFHLQ